MVEAMKMRSYQAMKRYNQEINFFERNNFEKKNNAICALLRNRKVTKRFPKVELIKKYKPKSNQHRSPFQQKHVI